MTSILKNVCINKLGDIVNEYNKTYNRTIKIKPLDVKDKTCLSHQYPKFQVGDHVSISKCKKHLMLKDILQIGLKKFL